MLSENLLERSNYANDMLIFRLFWNVFLILRWENCAQSMLLTTGKIKVRQYAYDMLLFFFTKPEPEYAY